MMFSHCRSRRKKAAFTLVELMVAMGLFVIGGSIVYPLFVGDFSLYLRNFSLNKSNNSLRHSLQVLERDIDMAIEPPVLMNYRVSGTTGILQPLSSATVSAQAILVWVNLGPSFDVVPTAGTGTGGTIAPSTGVTLNRASALPTVQVGDRLVFMYPAPYSTGMPETVTMDGVAMQKPGRRITSITNSTSSSISVQLDLTNTSLPTGMVGDKCAYIVREVAYIAYTVTNSAGTAVERQLVYYPTTNNMTSSQILVHDLDPLPQETDTNTGTTVQPFNYYQGRGSLSVLNVILPIRSVDFAHFLNDQHLGTAVTDTSAKEFDVYLRCAPQMGIKVRLD